ncbi:hypothetical protein CAEBREN_12985 [Caenorhabditis brenneri]|uniref:Uncharacterized protein n=1 Tax=Caenorhabditis brenneri TaxID=135651 RepID=G0NER3_CAEBE|nr:hypothetical protein CAEBREN_12985 [Caenorhabditis brenneri]
MSSDESETSETSTELLDIDVDFPTWKFLQTINSIEELTKMCDKYAKQKALPEIIEIMERIAEIQLVKNEDKPLDIVARNTLVNVLIPVFKYNNISNMYEAREISDLVHFYIYNEMRKHPFHQSFATSRALLTPHRRRQLAKTMNEDSRVFAYGLNSYHSLGDPMEEDFFYFAVPTEIKIPPVYEMRVSTHHSIFWLHDGRFFGCGDGRKFLMQLSSKQRPVLYKEPVQIDLVIRPGETITGFRTLEYGTLFETEKSWYFVGDYSKSCHYLQNVIWVIHDFVLYHGIMTPMLKEGHTDDERVLDNYILLIDFTEFRTPTPYQVTGIASSRSSGVLIKCGDYPNEYYDHMQLAELRYRGNVHKLMFESIDVYRTVCRTSDIYTGSGKDEEAPLTIDLVLEELDQIANNEQLGAELKSDWCGRIEKKDRYCNFFSFLGYISMPRLPGRPPKCFDTDIDSMVDIENSEYVARYRVRQLFEEFERVNYPGTDVWKPAEFLKEYPEPEDDSVSEGHYRAAAMRWALRTFGANMRTYNKSSMYKKDDKKTQIVIHYILNIIWYGTDLYYITNSSNPPPRRDKLNLFHKAIENIMPDDELIFASSNPGLVFDNRKKDGVVRDEDLDEPMNILVTYKMQHQTKNYVATRFKVMTCFSFLASQNPHLLLFVKNNVVDLNSVYPDDIRIQRLVVQTHFIGHGYTDIDDFFVTNEACNEIFTTAGYQLEIQQTYLKRGITHRRGNLVQTPKTPTCHIATTVKPEDYVTNNIEIETSDGITVYCHRQLKTVYSSLPLDDPLPNTLPCDLMLPALNGILDRMIYDDLPLRARIEIVAWYAEAKMHEAFIDLLKQCVMDVRQEDFKDFRILVEAYPTQMQRLIAQYRPGMIFWNHSPIPRPRVQHLKIILEMFPKNEYGRHTRVPRKHIINKKDEAEESVFRQISTRELRRYYMTERERKNQDYDISLFEKDFPLPYAFKPFKSTSKTKDYGQIKEGLYAPPVPLRRKTVALIAASERELEALPEQKTAQWYKPDPLSKRLENMFEEVTISEERENGDRMQQRLIGGKKNRKK